MGPCHWHSPPTGARSNGLFNGFSVEGSKKKEAFNIHDRADCSKVLRVLKSGGLPRATAYDSPRSTDSTAASHSRLPHSLYIPAPTLSYLELSALLLQSNRSHLETDRSDLHNTQAREH